MDDNVLSDGTITLSPLVLDDAEEWLAGQDAEQIRWFEFPRPAELRDVQRFITGTMQSWISSNGHWHWGIRRVDSPALVGGVDLRYLGDHEINLSYLTFPSFRNRGIATRASALALQYARDVLSARTAVIKMLSGNVFSTKVARKLGAHSQGTEPSASGFEFRGVPIGPRVLGGDLVDARDDT